MQWRCRQKPIFLLRHIRAWKIADWCISAGTPVLPRSTPNIRPGRISRAPLLRYPRQGSQLMFWECDPNGSAVNDRGFAPSNHKLTDRGKPGRRTAPSDEGISRDDRVLGERFVRTAVLHLS